MAESGRVDIRAYLHDHLTPGLKKVEKKLQDVKKASEQNIAVSKKAAYQASREGKAFEKLAKAEGVWFDARSKRWKQGNKFISAMKVEELRVRAHATRMAQATTATQKFTNQMRRLNGFLTQGADGHAKRAAQWTRIVKVYTNGATRVGAAHTKMAFKANMAVGAMQGAWAKATQKIHSAQSRLVFQTNYQMGRAQGAYTRFGNTAATVHRNMQATGGRVWKQASAGIGAMNKAALEADRSLLKMGKTFTKPLKIGYAAAGIGTAVVGASALAMGMTRINQMQAADVKLGVMGQGEEQRKSIMDMVDQTVRGTFVTLGEGMTMATQQMGAGVTNEGIKDRMAAVTDLAALYAPQDVGRVSMVTSQIQAKGRLTGEEALQLGELGAPVYDWVAEDLGVDKSQVADIIANGQYTADQFFAAMAPRIAGGAKKMGETFYGSWMLLKAAVARSGEAFLKPLLEPLRKGMLETISWLDSLKAWWGDLGTFLGVGLSQAFDKLPSLWNALEPLGLALKILFAGIMEFLPGLMDGLISTAGILGTIAIPLFSAFAATLAALSPAMIVLMPLLVGLAHAFAALFIITKLFRTIATARKGFDFLKKSVGQTRTAVQGLGTQTTRTNGIFSRLRTSVSNLTGRGNHGLAGLNQQLGLAGTNMNRNATMARRAAGGLGMMASSMAGYAAAQALGSDTVDQSAFGTALDHSKKQADEQIANAPWQANKDNWFGRDLNRIAGVDNIETVGEGFARSGNRSLTHDVIEAVAMPAKFLFGYKTPHDRLEETLKGMDPYLAGKANDPEQLDQARQLYSQILSDVTANGGTEADMLRLLPQVDALKKAGKFYRGGYTGDGPATAPAGIVHGREFVTNHWATNKLESATPGGLAYANATGQWPTSGASFSPSVTINAGAGSDPQAIAAAVRAELERQARRMSRHYGTPQLRGAR